MKRNKQDLTTGELIGKIDKLEAQIKELRATDDLTKLLNRRVLLEKLDYEMRRSSRNKKPLCVFLFNIDHLKKINDTHGHAVGDKILVQVAKNTSAVLRNTDIVGRYGGDEFIVILPECPFADGGNVAELIRFKLQRSEYEADVRVTISGGLVPYRDETADELIEAADRYLQEAKTKGRNRIEYPAG